MKIGIIVGTRPEIIKMAPVIRECERRKIPYFIVHSNQHYSADMDAIFFEELNLPAPNYNLNVGSGQHSNQTGNILIKIEPILLEEKPDVVLVQGDTNTVLAGALAASKLDIKVGHIEAGLRSYDRTMPEETNRVLTDHMSHYLFSVSDRQSEILKTENIPNERIIQVGNTISDALFQHLPLAQANSSVLQSLKVTPKEYFLLTAHRASNVDIKAHLEELVMLIKAIAEEYRLPIVWPIHPRTKVKLEHYHINLPSEVILTTPLGYLDFIQLQANAKIILTDSGGIQEEACMLQVPCVTLRENTERPETIDVKANVLVGRNATKALTEISAWIKQETYTWKNPFGDGEVAKHILEHIYPSDATSVTSSKNSGRFNVSVIGQGYMGLPIACLIAKAGHNVNGIDLDDTKVKKINEGLCPFDEPGLPELLRETLDSGRFEARQNLQVSDIYLIAVPTPHKDKKCDLSYVNSALEQISKVAQSGQLVIIESTISPQTSQKAQEYLEKNGLNIEVVHCPERAIPGLTLHELVNNDRIIGAPSDQSFSMAHALYSSFVQGEIFQVDTTTAECVKLVENTSRDVGIAFANELASVAEELGTDVHKVIELANKHPRVNILTPGPGVGGHCIPIDPWFLVESTAKGELIRLARKINDLRPIELAEKVFSQIKHIDKPKVGILGVAYKPNVDDTRETPAKAFADYLHSKGVEIKFYDPFVEKWDFEKIDNKSTLEKWADTTITITQHSTTIN